MDEENVPQNFTPVEKIISLQRIRRFKSFTLQGCGHDTTIMAVMYALGNYKYNGVEPLYSSALIFELRNKGKDSFIVVRYKNPQNSTPQLLEIPKCGKYCIVEKFSKMVHPLMITNWKLECQLKQFKNETNNEDVVNKDWLSKAVF